MPAPSLADLPTRLEGIIATDLETHDPGLRTHGPGWCYGPPDGHILGYGVWTPSFEVYLPVGHTEGNLPHEPVARWYKEVVAESSNDKVFANATYDIGWCRTAPVKPMGWNGLMHDILVQAPLIDEHRYSYDLDGLAKEKIPGSSGKSNALLIEAASKSGLKIKSIKEVKTVLKRLPWEVVGEYCIDDCRLTYELFMAQKEEIQAQGLEEIYALEIELTHLLIEMRARGIRVDVAEAERQCDPNVEGSLMWLENELVRKIKSETGVLIESCWAADQLAKALATAGIQCGVTPKTGKPSIDKVWLLGLNHPLATDINELRKINKVRTKFTHADIVQNSRGGRIHGQFNPLKSDEGGTISGRFSSSKPNLQQIPGRDKILGPICRGFYLPEEGCLWGSMDFSQQEPRAMVSMAVLSRIQSADAWLKRYIEDPNTDFHGMAAEFSGLPRDDAKELGLGIAYTMGSGKLAVKLGLPTEIKMITDRKTGKTKELIVGGPEAMAMIRTFNTKAGFIKELSNKCVSAAKSRGWIRTLLGRKFHYPLRDGEYFKAHKALNGLIQGMSADQVKKAMVLMFREGIVSGVQVHDELGRTDLTCPEDARRSVEIMLEAMPLPVPAKVDLEVGINWGVAKKNKVVLPGLPVIYTPI